ncbi:hypothetical protein [Gemmiger qucibialis]|uniref:hypothetical protein n=1 Tax=Gemmiger qucibialis TaxID=2997294 RepID=UPI0022E40A3A|nr:hypothetical protein [Gemmiger qucibialis]
MLHGGKKHIRHAGRQYPGRLQLLHRGKVGAVLAGVESGSTMVRDVFCQVIRQQ